MVERTDLEKQQFIMNTYVGHMIALYERHKRGLIDDSAFAASAHTNEYWFHQMFNPMIIIEGTRFTKKEMTMDYNSSFKYRGVVFDVYFDDYGQQEFCKFNFNGKDYQWSGGAYNSYAEYDFCQYLDYKIEDAFYKGEITGDILWDISTF